MGGTIECHPGHDLRMNKVLWAAAHLPDTFVRQPPDVRQIVEHDRPQGQAAFRRPHAGLEPLKYRVRELANDIELPLLMRGIADPNRRRMLVAAEPRNGQLGKPAFSADA